MTGIFKNPLEVAARGLLSPATRETMCWMSQPCVQWVGFAASSLWAADNLGCALNWSSLSAAALCMVASQLAIYMEWPGSEFELVHCAQLAGCCAVSTYGRCSEMVRNFACKIKCGYVGGWSNLLEQTWGGTILARHISHHLKSHQQCSYVSRC